MPSPTVAPLSNSGRSATFHERPCFGEIAFYDCEEGREAGGGAGASLHNAEEADLACLLFKGAIPKLVLQRSSRYSVLVAARNICRCLIPFDEDSKPHVLSAFEGEHDCSHQCYGMTLQFRRLCRYTSASSGTAFAGLHKHFPGAAHSVAVLTPYKAQMRKLRSTFAASIPPAQLATIDFATVDGFQARSPLLQRRSQALPPHCTQPPFAERLSLVRRDHSWP